MKRSLHRMSNQEYDLLIVGGGITGACLAWEATLRGLSVALVEKSDFGAATSAASSKLIHGGIRYLQQGLPGKVRESAAERRIFLRIAPHLIRPVPFLVPAYRGFRRGKALLASGMAAYDILTRGAGGRIDGDAGVDRFRILSRAETLQLEPGIPDDGLTGSALYPEYGMHSSERVTLAFLSGAAERGADLANHACVTAFLRREGRVIGVRVEDAEGGADAQEIRAKTTVNATGPWAMKMAGLLRDGSRHIRMAHSRGIHLVLRPLTQGRAIALATRARQGAVLGRGGRHVFLIPWRGCTLAGTTDVPFTGDLDEVAPRARDIDAFLADLATAWPNDPPSAEDVRFAWGGLYPLVNRTARAGLYQGSGEYRIWDHAATDGVGGMWTVLGAKFTTARLLAEKAVDALLAKQGVAPSNSPSLSRTTCLPGGDIKDPVAFADAAAREATADSGEAAMRELAYTFGSGYGSVLALAEEDPSLGRPVAPGLPVLRAAVVHAARAEMAGTLADVVFRRTGLGTIGHPGRECLEDCAALLARESGWDDRRVQSELAQVESMFGRMFE